MSAKLGKRLFALFSKRSGASIETAIDAPFKLGDRISVHRIGVCVGVCVVYRDEYEAMHAFDGMRSAAPGGEKLELNVTCKGRSA